MNDKDIFKDSGTALETLQRDYPGKHIAFINYRNEEVAIDYAKSVLRKASFHGAEKTLLVCPDDKKQSVTAIAVFEDGNIAMDMSNDDLLVMKTGSGLISTEPTRLQRLFNNLKGPTARRYAQANISAWNYKPL